MTYAYALLGAGVVLAVAGFFGPDDDGIMQLIGLVMIGLSIYSAYKSGNFPLPFIDDLK